MARLAFLLLVLTSWAPNVSGSSVRQATEGPKSLPFPVTAGRRSSLWPSPRVTLNLNASKKEIVGNFVDSVSMIIKTDDYINTIRGEIDVTKGIRRSLRGAGPLSAVLGTRTGQLLSSINVASYILVTQFDSDEGDWLSRSVVREAARRAIAVCRYNSFASFSLAADTPAPRVSSCFLHRVWTVLLLGSHTWAAGVVNNASTFGFYDQRVHWVGVVEGAVSLVRETLHLFHQSQRVTWLCFSGSTQGWVVLASELTADGMTAREGGRWSSHDDAAPLAVSRPLRPPYVSNFFQSTLRVISRYATDPKPVPNSVGRCYLRESGDTACTGYVGEMLMLLTHSLNLTIINRSITKCGIAGSRGTRVAVIHENEADIALGTCSITANRLQLVDFTEFFIVTRSSIASAEPDVVQLPFLVLNVLAWQTWACVAGYAAVATAVLWFSGRALAPLSQGSSGSLALVMKAFVLQGNRRQPSSSSGRAVVAVSWVVVITVVGVYSGNLTAWLSLPRYQEPIDSLEDVARRPDVVPVVRQNDPNHMMFLNRTKGVLGAVASRLSLLPRPSVEELARDIVYGKAVYFNSDRSHLHRATALNRAEGRRGFVGCRIHLSASDLRQDYIGLMLNKNSWSKEQMNERIRWLRSFGVVKKLYQTFNPPGCSLRTRGQHKEGSKPLTLRHLQGGFWIGAAGLATAALLLTTEHFLLSKFLQ